MRKNPLVIIFLFFLMTPAAWAEEKNWNAAGDKSDWFDGTNWFSAGVPASTDDVKLDMLDASAAVSQNFGAKTITLGGKQSASLLIGNFVAGSVIPDKPTDVAVENRRDGSLTLKGSAGRTTLKGSYKSSKKKLEEEPSYLFYVW